MSFFHVVYCGSEDGRSWLTAGKSEPFLEPLLASSNPTNGGYHSQRLSAEDTHTVRWYPPCLCDTRFGSRPHGIVLRMGTHEVHVQLYGLPAIVHRNCRHPRVGVLE